MRRKFDESTYIISSENIASVVKVIEKWFIILFLIARIVSLTVLSFSSTQIFLNDKQFRLLDSEDERMNQEIC